ncbi:MAG: hypothetical protein BWZ06_01675 [Bacteroidetes bacterium ADurb.BinA261]|jgi:hypothetical protein|nr:MAG: hypothetical protein BWZ06_01675 [Bacteroidetes bacterium ADurb.BinA261]
MKGKMDNKLKMSNRILFLLGKLFLTLLRPMIFEFYFQIYIL